MATDHLMRVCHKEKSDDMPLFPPGFESFAAFTLKKVQDSESKNIISCSASTSTCESQTVQVEMESAVCEIGKARRHLRRRSEINYGQMDNSSEDELDSTKLKHNPISRPHLPKGVVRGCPQCSNCQKVKARWRPESSCRPNLEDAPVFHPTEEEFEDTLKYISTIRLKAEPYGICRIVPPPSWKPPCLLKERTKWEGSSFMTRVQKVDKLQNRCSMKKISEIYNHGKKRRRRCMKMATDCGTHGGSDTEVCETESFGFEPGPDFTLHKFQKYADYFKVQYFRKHDNLMCKSADMAEKWEPTVENIEGEYWRIVENATEQIEVLYGADLETGSFGSGFPKISCQEDSFLNELYARSGWNLNNFPRLPGSVLSYESGDISGVLVPWLYVGMCFSSFCWHVEDHHLYSLNYLHWGAPKIWYGVPGKDAIKLEEAMKKHLPDLFEEQPDLLHKLVTQLSPSILKAEQVPVYRCVQNCGEFVLTFPRAYHAGFNCGFNCAEAVNVAPVDWLPHGQIAVDLYREQKRRTSISHDKLLLGAARDAVKAQWELYLLKKTSSDNLRWRGVCGKDGILAKALKKRVEMERSNREFLCNSPQSLKMDHNFDATSEKECTVCLFDLHLSAAGCPCSPDRYACLNHAKQLCSCSWATKFFLFRHDMNELNMLVEALEGRLSAVYRWARQGLGLALTSHISDDTLQHGRLSKLEELEGRKEVQASGISGYITTTIAGIFGDPNSDDEMELPEHNVSSSSLNSHCLKQNEISKHDVILLSDDEDKEPLKSLLLQREKLKLSANPSELSEMLSISGNNPEHMESTQSISPSDTASAGEETAVANHEKEDLMGWRIRCVQQKGPRTAKVVRRISGSVEPLELGFVLHETWCTSKAIFPKGFKSRVKHTSVLDPTNSCFYISQILDAGLGRPLFMVSIEHCPSDDEVFIHVSESRCWDLVRERVNQEITKRRVMGQPGLPRLQPAGSIDGFDMFGFSSPSIMQAIEALDEHRICADYWNSRLLNT